jgi:hypothetical protein
MSLYGGSYVGVLDLAAAIATRLLLALTDREGTQLHLHLRRRNILKAQQLSLLEARVSKKTRG